MGYHQVYHSCPCKATRLDVAKLEAKQVAKANTEDDSTFCPGRHASCWACCCAQLRQTRASKLHQIGDEEVM